MTSSDDPCTERIIIFIIAVDPNEAERASHDIYYDFKSKKTFSYTVTHISAL